jgi:hypothetical protein
MRDVEFCILVIFLLWERLGAAGSFASLSSEDRIKTEARVGEWLVAHPAKPQ